ncbi:MAG: ATP-binding protein, partial [Actinomycetota bacterium]
MAAAALAATAAAAVWSFVVGWTLIRSINSLAIAIDGVAEAQLGIANGHLEVSELPSIEHQGPEDEIGRVAKAVDAISASAVEMADAQRETIRKGLATIVINLARRNQSLLDRQVEYLDKLEQTEEDPDRLAQLFRVDHLATRMRRNAESLLVLAGADTAKRKGAPVAMSDVLRVAIGEVENYQHIELGVVEDGDVPAGVAVDLAHLTAELMENATQFSPPSTNVVVSAVVDRPTQSVHVSVADRGMGLGDRLEQANETLADPPELGLGMGRSLGFMVIGRLAKRLGATVELRANDGGGTVAEVRIPLRLFQLEQAAQPAAPAQQLPPLNQPPATPTPAGPPQAQTPPQPAPRPHPP